MNVKDKIPKTVKLKTYIVTLMLISVIFAGILNYSLSAYVGDVSEVWVQPPFHEASYAVGVYNSTYYYAKNGTTGEYEWLSTNDDTVIQNAIDTTNSSGGGSVFVKSGTYTASVTVKANVLLILEAGVSGVTYTVNTNAYCIRYSGGYGWFEQPLNMTGHEIKYGAFHTGTSAPSSPNIGQWWYDTNTYNLKIYNGTDWATVQGAQGAQGEAGTLEGEQPYSYLIFENATSKYLQDGENGNILTNSNDANILVQWVVDNYTNWWLHFTSGVFECYTDVDFTTETYFMISGSGWATELELNGNLGTDVDFWSWNYTALSHGRFTIKDLYFDMDGDTYTSRDCLHIVGGERWTLQNIKVLRPHRDGLNIDENTGDGYTRYNTITNFQVYYSGRYGIYCDGRDNFFYDLQVEYSYDSCVVFDSDGAGNYVCGLHSTGAHNTGQIGYTSQRGGGNSRYSGLEVLGSGNSFDGLYLDRCNKTGAYITGQNNGFIGRRVYECNYQAGSSNYADVYITGDFNRVIGMELNGQASYPTNYGVHLTSTANNNTVVGNAIRDHASADVYDEGSDNQIGYNS